MVRPVDSGVVLPDDGADLGGPRALKLHNLRSSCEAMQYTTWGYLLVIRPALRCLPTAALCGGRCTHCVASMTFGLVLDCTAFETS